MNITFLDVTIDSDLYSEKMFKLMTNITVLFGRLVVCFGTFMPSLLVLNTRIISLRMKSCHNRLQVRSLETCLRKCLVILWLWRSSKVNFSMTLQFWKKIRPCFLDEIEWLVKYRKLNKIQTVPVRVLTVYWSLFPLLKCVTSVDYSQFLPFFTLSTLQWRHSEFTRCS